MGDLRFPRAARLASKVQFDQVFSKGIRHHTSLFRLHALASPEQPARLGLAITKRVAPHAHERNRLRRQAREAFRHWRERLAGIDIVVVAKSSAVDRPAKELRQDLDQAFDRLWSLNRNTATGTIPP
jgi:ribonuclease P protein component